MKKVLLDTNALLLPGQEMIDIFTGVDELLDEPYVLAILEKSMGELHKLAQKKTKDARAAKLALGLVNARIAENPTLWDRLIGLTPQRNARELKVIKARQYVDDAIVELADKDTIVFTLDRELKKRLKKKSITLIGLRNKRLSLER